MRYGDDGVLVPEIDLQVIFLCHTLKRVVIAALEDIFMTMAWNDVYFSHIFYEIRQTCFSSGSKSVVRNIYEIILSFLASLLVCYRIYRYYCRITYMNIHS